MVKILDFNFERNFWQKVIVCMVSLIYICLDLVWPFHLPDELEQKGATSLVYD